MGAIGFRVSLLSNPMSSSHTQIHIYSKIYCLPDLSLTYLFPVKCHFLITLQMEDIAVLKLMPFFHGNLWPCGHQLFWFPRVTKQLLRGASVCLSFCLQTRISRRSLKGKERKLQILLQACLKCILFSNWESFVFQ